MIVIKRDGTREEFDPSKIKRAVLKAFIEEDGEATASANKKSSEIAKYVGDLDQEEIDVERIQDIVEERLMASARKRLAAIAERNDEHV